MRRRVDSEWQIVQTCDDTGVTVVEIATHDETIVGSDRQLGGGTPEVTIGHRQNMAEIGNFGSGLSIANQRIAIVNDSRGR